MKNQLKYAFSMMLAGMLFTSCENGDAEFPDFQDGTTAYFAYQYPVRTIVLGDDEYDTTLDQAHKCKILATFGGSYNGSNGTVQVAVDNSLTDNLYFEDGSKVKPMPTEFYTLATTNFAYNGTMNGGTEVQLTDAFFNDPDAVKNTYVIPLVMQSQVGFTRIATGTLKEGASPIRTDESQWEKQPMDYTLYCVKFQNKYSGYWLTHHTASIDNIEKAQDVQITTKSLKQSVYTVSKQFGSTIRKAELLLTFDDNDNCTISSLTDGATVTGTGTFTDAGAKKSWGNKDRDLIELTYTVNFGGDHKWTVNEKLVWFRSGVSLATGGTSKEFAPTYKK